ncbi:fibrocystin-L-like [Pecten maximus]|uniref:fibrocystin-L-like n=1 Tax=Pecten maximus TaxID=6579 RepID=UPI001458171E|nr:fibrocystin-L-like [Pecten maximus]
MKLSKMTLINVDDESRVYFHLPNLGKINPSDCVDMDCDGLKQTLIKDLDGTFTGRPGTIIGRSALAWNGDRRRGLGDYRIPKVMLTEYDGTRIELRNLFTGKGISRQQSCRNDTVWNAYYCAGMDHAMLMIESMDKDTETRRVGPVAMLGNGYIDLINGPQDHGWCAGYTCQKRLSTFPVVVAIGVEYQMYFSSTNPQHLRFFLLNSNPSQAIIIVLYYKVSNTLSVYHNGDKVQPKNAHYADGTIKYHTPSTPRQYVPLIDTDPSGSNFYDWDKQQLYVLIRGSDPVEIKMDKLILVSLTLPPMTVNQFFLENLIGNVAALLNINKDKIKVVRVVSEASKRRKKRETQPDIITFAIGNEPAASISNSTNATNNGEEGDLSPSELDTVYNTLTNDLATEGATSLFNLSVEATVAVSSPLPEPGTDDWTAQSNDTERTMVVVSTVNSMSFLTTPGPLHEGARFIPQPRIQMLDQNGEAMAVVGSVISPWRVTATLEGGDNPNATLMGTVSVPVVNGIADYTDLSVSHFGDNFALRFTVTYPQNLTRFTLVTTNFTLPRRPVVPLIHEQSDRTVSGRLSSINVKLVDNVTKLDINDIDWRGHTWNATIELGSISPYNNGTLTGSQEVTFDPATGMAVFNNLNFTHRGSYFLIVRIKSDPAEYEEQTPVSFRVISPDQENIIPQVSKLMRMKFDVDFKTCGRRKRHEIHSTY